MREILITTVELSTRILIFCPFVSQSLSYNPQYNQPRGELRVGFVDFSVSGRSKHLDLRPPQKSWEMHTRDSEARRGRSTRTSSTRPPRPPRGALPQCG